MTLIITRKIVSTEYNCISSTLRLQFIMLLHTSITFLQNISAVLIKSFKTICNLAPRILSQSCILLNALRDLYTKLFINVSYITVKNNKKWAKGYIDYLSTGQTSMKSLKIIFRSQFNGREKMVGRIVR